MKEAQQGCFHPYILVSALWSGMYTLPLVVSMSTPGNPSSGISQKSPSSNSPSPLGLSKNGNLKMKPAKWKPYFCIKLVDLVVNLLDVVRPIYHLYHWVSITVGKTKSTEETHHHPWVARRPSFEADDRKGRQLLSSQHSSFMRGSKMSSDYYFTYVQHATTFRKSLVNSVDCKLCEFTVVVMTMHI